MQLVTGIVRTVHEREVTTGTGRQWTERTLVIEDWGRSDSVRVGRELQEAGVPTPGEHVAIEVAVFPYALKDANGRPDAERLGVETRGLRRNAEAERMLFGAGSPALKAAN